jgi:hypothetical protein
VAGNALVASTEAVDPRLLRALGAGWAHAVSSLAHAAPAVTMILFAHLAGLLMAGRSVLTEDARAAVADLSKDVTDGLEGGHRPRSWPYPGHPSNGHGTGDDRSTSVVTATRTAADHGSDRAIATAMTAAEARQAVVRLVREDASGRHVTAADVQRLTGRGARQARRLLALAAKEADLMTSTAQRPRVMEGDR